MTAPSLLDELEGVAGLADRLDRLSDAVAKQEWREFSMRVPAEPDRDADLVLARVARFIRTHHAEIAEAVMDAARWRKARDCCDYVGVYQGLASADCGLELLAGDEADAAIDAATHNSAWEVGE